MQPAISKLLTGCTTSKTIRVVVASTIKTRFVHKPSYKAIGNMVKSTNNNLARLQVIATSRTW